MFATRAGLGAISRTSCLARFVQGGGKNLPLPGRTFPLLQTHKHQDNWRSQFEDATVHVQWDPERTIHGKKLEHRSVQVGLGRDIIRDFTDDWILDITDFTARTRKIRSLYLAGNLKRAKDRLPSERVYPVSDSVIHQLGMDR